MKIAAPFLYLGRRWSLRTGRRRRTLLALGVLVIIVIGAGAIVAARAERASPSPGALVAISAPSGVRLRIDRRDVGPGPMRVSLGVGRHTVADADARDLPSKTPLRVAVGQTTRVSFRLWCRTLTVMVRRPSLAGATNVNADFLADGPVAFVGRLPTGPNRPVGVHGAPGRLHRVGPSHAVGPIALSADGQTIAQIAGEGPTHRGAAKRNIVVVSRLVGRFAPRRVPLPRTEVGQPSDLRWAPDGCHLLVPPRAGSSGSRPRFRRRDVRAGHVVALVTAAPRHVSWLFAATLRHPVGARTRGIAGNAPTFWEDGTIVAVARGRGGACAMRERWPHRASRVAGSISLPLTGPFAIRWDPRHGRAIVVSRAHDLIDSSAKRDGLVDLQDVTR